MKADSAGRVGRLGFAMVETFAVGEEDMAFMLYVYHQKGVTYRGVRSNFSPLRSSMV